MFPGLKCCIEFVCDYLRSSVAIAVSQQVSRPAPSQSGHAKRAAGMDSFTLNHSPRQPDSDNELLVVSSACPNGHVVQAVRGRTAASTVPPRQTHHSNMVRTGVLVMTAACLVILLVGLYGIPTVGLDDAQSSNIASWRQSLEGAPPPAATRPALVLGPQIQGHRYQELPTTG